MRNKLTFASILDISLGLNVNHIENRSENWFAGSASDQKSIDISQFNEILGISFGDGACV